MNMNVMSCVVPQFSSLQYHGDRSGQNIGTLDFSIDKAGLYRYGDVAVKYTGANLYSNVAKSKMLENFILWLSGVPTKERELVFNGKDLAKELTGKGGSSKTVEQARTELREILSTLPVGADFSEALRGKIVEQYDAAIDAGSVINDQGRSVRFTFSLSA